VLRTTSITIILIMGLALIIPVCILVHFQLDRERIANELCVQRAVTEETRTCHGECHLRDQLRSLQADDPQQAPVETNVLTLIPVFIPEDPYRPFISPASETVFGMLQIILVEGHNGTIEQVPRS
jgi:hypothetical protein